MAPELQFTRVLRASFRVCSGCGAMVYDRDDAEKSHRDWHEAVLFALAQIADRISAASRG